MKDIILQNPICAILRGADTEAVIPYAKAVFDGGVRMFEVAMNTEGAAQQIEMLREAFGDGAMIGAGTVINEERCLLAEQAGAQFFLTPSATESTLRFCAERDIPLLPGVMTPTDVAVCLSYGYTTMKLFPAGDLPLGYIKSLKGPYSGTEYVAVGGVGPNNIKQFFDAGFIGVGIGSSLAPKALVTEGRWDEVTEYVANLVKEVKK